MTEVDMREWQRTMSVNLLGPILMCRHGIPRIVEAGGGAVVNMSSGAALRGASPAHIYTASKGGILSLTRALAGAYRQEQRAGERDLRRPHPDRAHHQPLRHAGTPGPVVDLQDAAGRVKEYPFWVGSPEDIARIALFPRFGRVAHDHGREHSGRRRPLGLLSAPKFRHPHTPSAKAERPS